MIPYISWISFATYLNYYVWANNSQEKIKGNWNDLIVHCIYVKIFFLNIGIEQNQSVSLA